VEVGDCWTYALEAILKCYYLFPSLKLMFMFYAITAMVLESTITTRLRGKLMCMCRIINGKIDS
jgi:hypothetical protein